MTISFTIDNITGKEADDLADQLLRYLAYDLDILVSDHEITE